MTMLRRISGSSSITSIFFITSFGEHRQSDGDNSSFAEVARQAELASVQLDAALDQQQAETGSRPAAHVAAPMKGSEQPLLILLRDADPVVLDHAHHESIFPKNTEANRDAR